MLFPIMYGNYNGNEWLIGFRYYFVSHLRRDFVKNPFSMNYLIKVRIFQRAKLLPVFLLIFIHYITNFLDVKQK